MEERLRLGGLSFDVTSSHRINVTVSDRLFAMLATIIQDNKQAANVDQQKTR